MECGVKIRLPHSYVPGPCRGLEHNARPPYQCTYQETFKPNNVPFQRLLSDQSTFICTCGCQRLATTHTQDPQETGVFILPATEI